MFVVTPPPFALTSAACHGALTGLVLAVADAEDPAQARDQVLHLIGGMRSGLR